MSTQTRACALIACLLLSACASRKPADADWRTLAIQPAAVDASRPTARTKGDVAISSALKGGGGGLVWGAVFCAAIVPVAAPGCLGIIAPVTVAAGAVSGGVIGGSVARNSDPAPAELTARLDTAASQERLMELLRQHALASAGSAPAPAPEAASAPAAAYALSVALAELRMQRVSQGKPTPLILLARAQMLPSSGGDVLWTKDYRIIGTDKRPATEWAAAPDAVPIESLLDRLADRIDRDLAPRGGKR